jgi:HEPN domain-containing protein
MSAILPISYRAWLRKAEHDVTAINRVMVRARVPWDIVCFHAQKATKNVLKAFLVFHGQMPAKTHDCAFLLIECAKIVPSLAPLRADCRYVTCYGAPLAIPISAPIRQRSRPSQP